MKLGALKQWEEESVIDFNHRFETVASRCTLGDDEAKEIYLDCLRVKLREALAFSAPESLPQAIMDAISVDVNYSRLGQQPQAVLTPMVSQVNQLATRFQDLGPRAHPIQPPMPEVLQEKAQHRQVQN